MGDAHDTSGPAHAGRYDLIVVGAGPIGLSTALHARHRGLNPLVLDRGTIANHFLDFPVAMPFFTPAFSLELIGIPIDVQRGHATREELLSYYGRLVRLARLAVHGQRTFVRVEGEDGDLTVVARDAEGGEHRYRGQKVVLATGVFGTPRRLAPIPGATHPNVVYRYRDPFAYAGRDVVLVGAGNSSAGAALGLHHAGARVTVIDRNASIPAMKWRWHLDDLRALVAAGEIRVLHDAQLVEITRGAVLVQTSTGTTRLPADAVIPQLGYEPDPAVLAGAGVALDPESGMPQVDGRTLETRRKGVYLAGIVVAGTSPDKVFVWGGRHHGRAIVHHILTGAPLPCLRDLGGVSIEHWAQFHDVPEIVDEELLLRIVPVVTGMLGDDSFDVYERATNARNLYAEAPSQVADGAVGARPRPLLETLNDWLVHRNDDGSVIFKGQRLSESAFAIVQKCDGTRRMSEIVTQLAIEYEQPEAELSAMVIKLVSSLIRSGKLGWRTTPLVNAP